MQHECRSLQILATDGFQRPIHEIVDYHFMCPVHILLSRNLLAGGRFQILAESGVTRMCNDYAVGKLRRRREV